MFSKRNFLFCLITFVVAFAFMGCSRFFDKKEKKKDPVVLQTDTGWMEDLGKNIDAFFKNEAKGEQVHEIFAGLRKCLVDFEAHTVGAKAEGYLPSELKSFLERKKFLNRTIPEPLVASFFEVKVFLVGGTETLLSRAEIKELVQKTEKLEQLAVDVQGALPYFFGSKKVDFYSQKEEAAFERTQKSIEALARYLLVESPKSPQSFSFEKTIQLVRDTLVFLDAGKAEKPFLKYFPLIRAAAQVILSPEYYSSGSKESWAHIASLVGPGMDLGFRYKYLFAGVKLDNVLAVQKVEDLSMRALLAAEHILSARSNEVPFANIDAVIREFETLETFPSYLTNEVIEETYKRVIVRLLDERPIKQKEKTASLTLNHLRTFEKEFLVWGQTQAWINAEFDGKGPFLEKNYLAKSLKEAAPLIKSGMSQKFAVYEQDAIRDEVKSFSQIVEKNQSLIWTAESQVLITSQYSKQWTWGSLGIANILRGIVRLAFAGYAEDPVRSANRSGLTPQELETLYNELRPLGIAVGFMDPRNSKSGLRTFKEGNIFTWQADGNEYIDQLETIELVSLLFSGGFTINRQVQAHPSVKDCATAERDIFGKSYLKEDCFQEAFANYFSKFMAHMPHLSSYVASLTPERKISYFDKLRSLSLSEFSKKGLVETGEIRTSIMILMYIEVLFLTYDADLNMKLSEAEAMQAFPRFKNFLLAMMPEPPSWVPFATKEKLAPSVYKLIVFEGEKPGAARVIDTWISGRPFTNQIDRSDALNVFKALTGK